MDWHAIWSFLKPLLIGFLGGGTAFWGLFKFGGQLWLERLKNKYSKELEGIKDQAVQEQKRLQAKIDTAVLVTRAQFETEFKAMQELFSHLAEVRLTMNTLRPTFGTSSTDKEEQMRVLLERYNAFSDAFNQLVKHQEGLSPFYSQELYIASDKCTAAAQTELYQVMTGGPFIFTPQWYREGRENQERFLKAYGEASAIIRERISKLAVLPAAS